MRRIAVFAVPSVMKLSASGTRTTSASADMTNSSSTSVSASDPAIRVRPTRWRRTCTALMPEISADTAEWTE